MPLEIEAKFTNIQPEALRTRLAGLGFECTRPWSLMRRYTFFLSELNPSPFRWARVRDNGDGHITMAYKQEHDNSVIDGTEEVEFSVSDFDAACAFMKKLGFEDCTYQENYRETWQKDGVEVTLNQWPALEAFAEVEAATEEAVRKASAELGFAYEAAVFGGVGRLYDAHPQWQGIPVNGVKALTFAWASGDWKNQIQTV